MGLSNRNIGYGITGSFCTFEKTKKEVIRLTEMGANIVPIFSYQAQTCDTRFGKADEFVKEICEITGNPGIKTIPEAEPIGPKSCLDIMVIAPCTGNTLAKMANGITDSSVSMAAKAHLRNQKPVLVAVSTNDGLANAAKNIGILLNNKNIYFVPFGQDDPQKKPTSLVADMTKIIPAAELALEGKQLQPILC